MQNPGDDNPMHTNGKEVMLYRSEVWIFMALLSETVMSLRNFRVEEMNVKSRCD